MMQAMKFCKIQDKVDKVWLLEINKFAMLRFSLTLVINSDMLLEFAQDTKPKLWMWSLVEKY